MRRYYHYLMIALLAVAGSSCFLFKQHEKDKAKKVRAYFVQLRDLQFHDIWEGAIGPNIYEVKAKRATKLQTLGHTIQCDREKCFNTFNDKKGGAIFFTDKLFEKKLERSVVSYIKAQAQDACSTEFLVLHAGVHRKDYLKVLKVMRDLECEARIIGQKKLKIPPWPELGKKVFDERDKAAKMTPGPKRTAFEKKWFASLGKPCRFISQFKTNTKTIKRAELLLEKLYDAFAISTLTEELDKCEISSAKINMILRIYVLGYSNGAHDLFEKKISLKTDGPGIRIDETHTTWGVLQKSIWNNAKSEPTLIF